ncbi:Uma2 family endonuclease [Aeromicrobium piscarium]|uniref:Uma2 family endonuclease n=1 Tax=Aeromicrobium piscarium TaxID=2590901 RepID=A0A554SPM5_9ACTN|nr:Uma2 family endonuclease [Aeromicrobium piscarium]TSD68229.1 Uma2 family endonuclease [Aeromicrobium piscarium]
MAAVSSTPRGLPRGRSLTREDLAEIPDDGHRYELVDGVLVVSPAPRIAHQNAVMQLIVRLAAVCPPWAKVLPAPVDVVLAEDTVIQPDLLIAASADFTEEDLPGPPLLAVEVLSPSTRGIDLLLKKDRWERAGCAYYWVVDPAEPSITAWTLTDGSYRQTTRAVGDETFEVTEPVSLAVAPEELLG